MATVTQHEHEHGHGFAFVSVNKLGKTQPTDRRTIRSHCMRGKNRTIGLEPRAPRHVSQDSTKLPSSSGSSLSSSLSVRPASCISGSGSACGSGFEGSGPKLLSLSPALVKASVLEIGQVSSDDQTRNHLQLHHSSRSSNEEENEDTYTQPNPHILTNIYTPSTLSLLHFAFEVGNDGKVFLLDFLNAFTSTMYPATAFTAYDIATCPWANWAFTDASYLQCVFFMASVLRDLSQSPYPTHAEHKSRSTTAKTYGALRNTIIFLNSRLSNPDRDVSLADSTVAVVVILTMFCCMIGDHEGARVHVSGLKMLVSLRGGMQGFKGNEKLAIKLSRIDLVYALNSGSQGMFCTRPIQPAYAPVRLDNIYLDAEPGTIHHLIDPRLLPIFIEMQHYSALINNAHVTRQRRTIEEYHSVVCSFQYRLLQMQGVLEDGVSECLRLAMLAFLITTFQFPGTRARYPYLASCLKRACCEVMGNGTVACEMRDIMGWVMIVGAISVFDINAEEGWIKMMWKCHVDVVDWCIMRGKLKSIMWVDVLQDAAGQTAFQQLNKLCL